MLLDLALSKPEPVAAYFATRVAAIQALLAHTAEPVRTLAARALAAVSGKLSQPTHAELLQQLCAKLPAPGSTDLPKGVKFEEVHGCTAAAGLLIAASAAQAQQPGKHDRAGGAAHPAAPSDAVSTCTKRLLGLLGSAHAQLATNAALALGHMQLAGALRVADGDLEALDVSTGASGASAAGVPCPWSLPILRGQCITLILIFTRRSIAMRSGRVAGAGTLHMLVSASSAVRKSASGDCATAWWQLRSACGACVLRVQAPHPPQWPPSCISAGCCAKTQG